MKLPRSKGSLTDIDVEIGGGNTIDLTTTAIDRRGKNDSVVSLRKQEVSDLITMLQYYKLQVWPDDKENR